MKSAAANEGVELLSQRAKTVEVRVKLLGKPEDQGKDLGALFGNIEKAKDELRIVEYAVTPTTLIGVSNRAPFYRSKIRVPGDVYTETPSHSLVAEVNPTQLQR